MKDYQCSKYLYGIKRKIIREFYGIEESNDAEILDTAKKDFDVNSFPFNISDRDWSWDKQHGFKFVTPVDKGVIFNLKSHLAASLAKDVLENMQVSSTAIPFNKKKYLWHGEFDNKESCQQFEREFLSRMKSRYKNAPKNPLKIEGNSVYIKDVFDDARFIDSVTRYVTWLEGMYLGVDSSTNHRVKLFKDMIVESIGESTGVTIYGFMCASPLNRKEASVLIPIMQNCRGARLLTKEEARDINRAFNYTVLNDLYGRTQAELSTNGSSEVYGIDFSNPEISYCVITKIMESSVINKDHELAIDPELHFRASTPVQSPVRVPNGPSSSLTGLSSPIQEFPTQSQGGALKESPRRESEKFPVLLPVNQLDVPGTSRKFLPSTQLSFPTVNPGISGPSSSLQSVGAAQNVQASTNLWIQQQQSFSGPIRFPSRGPRFSVYARPPSVHSEDSGLGSSRPASTSSTVYSADSGFGSRPPSTLSNCENQKELTEKELIINKFLKNVKEIAAKMIDTKQIITKERIDKYIEGFVKLEKVDQTYQYCISFDEGYFKSKESRAKSIFDIFYDNYITVLDSALNRCGLKNSDSYEYKNDKLYIKDINVIKKIAENARMPDRESSPEWTQPRPKAGANKRNNVLPLSKEEELTKALLHRFNCSNYIAGEVCTNFILEDGKIVSLLDVDTTEYFKKVRAHIIENDCGTEGVARKVYDFGQFPFVFPPEPQRNEDGKIIIAHNIDYAIPNLKVHLIQDFRIQVEEDVAKKLEKMGVTEARERIKESVYLSEKRKNPGAWYIYFDDKPFQGGSELFKELKKIYIETFKSRWKECGLDDSLVSHENGVLYIENAIDINVVKKIGEYEKKEYEKLQESADYTPEERSLVCFPSEGIEGESPIILEKGQYLLDHDFGSDESMDCREPLPGFDRGNTGRKSQKRKSPSPSSEDEGGPKSKSSRSESSSSSSEEEAGSPCSNLSDSELCGQFSNTRISKR
ncbi:uncharacterized protein TNCT_706201 [Trichonephila clavata]|uniref:Uncharacterized protein n=1 Tax=Trichonephila clavata TaxID=2740835 RepID=A0A8X6LQR6_TRICU|nr:uncharacterized protein TNCT_706201 [Trichonephila clavata]